MSKDFSNEVPLPISILGKKSGVSKRELTIILCHPKSGVQVRRAIRDSKKILYFKGIRLYECFISKNGEKVDVKNSKQVHEFGQWLLDERYIILNKIIDKQKKEIARNKDPNPIFSQDGFYTWTQYAALLLEDGDQSDDNGDVVNVDFSKTSSNIRKRGKNEDDKINQKIEKDLGIKKKDADKSSGGISWLHVAILLMIIAPSLFAVIGYFIPAETPRQKLTNFYAKYAPEKNNAKHINKLLNKYQGSEDKLFKKLERKYEHIRIREEAMKRDEP
jgi:hypothetical protein